MIAITFLPPANRPLIRPTGTFSHGGEKGAIRSPANRSGLRRDALRGSVSRTGLRALNPDRLESRLRAADGRRPPEGGTPTGTVRLPGVTWFPQILNQARI